MKNLRKPLGEKKMALLMAMLIALMPFSIDAYLPAIPEMAQNLGSNIHRIEQSLSMFMFGVAFGQVAGGSISDIKGRKPVALAGLSIYLVSVFGLSLVNTAEQLLALRAVQAFGAGMTVVIVGALIRDFYDGLKAAQMFALIGIILMVVPLMAPMIGALLQSLGGWRAIFVFLFVYTVILLVSVLRFLPNPPMAKNENGSSVLKSVVGRFQRVFQTREALGYMFFQAFSFASMFAFLTESSFVYMNLYGASPHGYAWMFALNIITMATFNRFTAWRLKSGTHPQNILLWGIVIQLIANFSLLLLTWIAGLPPLWAVVLCVMFSVGTQGLVGANTQACFMNYFKAESGSANAVLGVCQSLIAAGMGMLVTWLHNGSAHVMSTMMFAATCCGIALLWLFSRSAWKQNNQNKINFS